MEAPLILDRYRPLETLGEGGHGTVVLAYDEKMARRVAIKRIPLSEAGVRRLASTTGLREARTTALLNHPNVVTVHEWDTDEDEAFLIMEHVDGADLVDVLDERAPLGPDAAAAVLAPVAEALCFAHDNGVYHLDLKPENVLVTRDGHVKVGDFGVAALTNAAGHAISAGGTLGYMPPEQLLGETVDATADQWAYAALAFEVLTGEVPFAAGDVDEALAKAEDPDAPLVSDHEPGLPAEIDDVLARALSPVPEERYGSVRDLASELLPLLGDPREGVEDLRDMLDSLTAEEEPGIDVVGVGLWERLAPRSAVAVRVLAALTCAWLAWSGIAAAGQGTASRAIVAGLTAAAAAAAPQLGIAVALVMFGAGIGFVFGPLVLAAYAVLAVAWWVLVVRRHPWAGLIPLLGPVFGVAGIAGAAPLLAGLTLPGSWVAVAAGGAASLTTAAAALASGQASPPLLRVTPVALADPLTPTGWGAAGTGVWWLLPAVAMVAGWAAAAAVTSYASRRGTRISAAAGAIGGSFAMLAALAPWATAVQRSGAEVALHVGLSLILVLALISLGPPVPAGRDEKD